MAKLQRRYSPSYSKEVADILDGSPVMYLKAKANGHYYRGKLPKNQEYERKQFGPARETEEVYYIWGFDEEGGAPRRFYRWRFVEVPEEEYIAAAVDWVIAGKPPIEDPRE